MTVSQTCTNDYLYWTIACLVMREFAYSKRCPSSFNCVGFTSKLCHGYHCWNSFCVQLTGLLSLEFVLSFKFTQTMCGKKQASPKGCDPDEPWLALNFLSHNPWMVHKTTHWQIHFPIVRVIGHKVSFLIEFLHCVYLFRLYACVSHIVSCFASHISPAAVLVVG